MGSTVDPYQGKVTIAVDKTSRLACISEGHAGANGPQARIARALWQAVQSRLSTSLHVPGHSGHEVNEIADFLAGYVCAPSRGVLQVSSVAARHVPAT